MTELSIRTVRLTAGIVYLGAFAVGAVGLRSVDTSIRRYLVAFVCALAVSGLSLIGQAIGFGSVQLGSGSVNLFSTIANVVSFAVVYGGIAALGGASRRLCGVVVAVAVTPLIALTVAPLLQGGAVLVVLGAFFLPYPVMLYAYFRPVWRQALRKSAGQRLLYWKTRNVVAYVYGVFLLYLVLSIVGLIPEGGLSTALLQYTSMFSSIGVTLFLLYKLRRNDLDISLFDQQSTAG